MFHTTEQVELQCKKALLQQDNEKRLALAGHQMEQPPCWARPTLICISYTERQHPLYSPMLPIVAYLSKVISPG